MENVTTNSEAGRWFCEWTVEKYRGIPTPESHPYAVIHGKGNMLMYGGVSALWDRLIDPTPTVTEFDNTNSFLGVGTGTTPALATQTDLQGASKHREAMDATFPTHTDGTATQANAQATWKSTFETGDANFAWNEWGIFNHASAGRMLNRKVASLGTKTSSDTWSLTVTITIT